MVQTILCFSDRLLDKMMDQDLKTTTQKTEQRKQPEAFLRMKSDFGISVIIHVHTSQWGGGRSELPQLRGSSPTPHP